MGATKVRQQNSGVRPHGGGKGEYGSLGAGSGPPESQGIKGGTTNTTPLAWPAILRFSWNSQLQVPESPQEVTAIVIANVGHPPEVWPVRWGQPVTILSLLQSLAHFHVLRSKVEVTKLH